MRLRVCLDNPHGTRLPINHQEWLTAAVYGLLAASDADYAALPARRGLPGGGRAKTFKLFTFSWLRGAARRTVDGGRAALRAGPAGVAGRLAGGRLPDPPRHGPAGGGRHCASARPRSPSRRSRRCPRPS